MFPYTWRSRVIVGERPTCVEQLFAWENSAHCIDIFLETDFSFTLPYSISTSHFIGLVLHAPPVRALSRLGTHTSLLPLIGRAIIIIITPRSERVPSTVANTHTHKSADEWSVSADRRQCQFSSSSSTSGSWRSGTGHCAAVSASGHSSSDYPNESMAEECTKSHAVLKEAVAVLSFANVSPSRWSFWHR